MASFRYLMLIGCVLGFGSFSAVGTPPPDQVPDHDRRSGAADRPAQAEEGKGGTKGSGKPAKGPRTIFFAGHEWDVKDSGSEQVGPGPNYFSSSERNVWVDSAGRLHLRIDYSKGRWRTAEVVSKTSFGYGTYRFYLDSPVNDLDPSAVLGLFTFDRTAPEVEYREIDIEFSRWSDPAEPLVGQYVVQPYYEPGHMVRFEMPPFPETTHSFEWTSGAIHFRSLRGHLAEPLEPTDIIDDWTYPFTPFTPGAEKARLNLWLFRGTPPTDGRPVEVVVSGFEFIPWPQ